MLIANLVHTMGAPLAHTCSTFAREAWLPFSDMNILSSKNVMFVQGIAKSIEMEMKVASFTAPGSDTEQKIPYDYLVVATGTKRDFPIVPKASRKQDYLKDADRHIGFLENAGKIVVVGGGSFHPYQGQHIS
jgi:NADH dehydrogenase FAD-containing subunit